MTSLGQFAGLYLNDSLGVCLYLKYLYLLSCVYLHGDPVFLDRVSAGLVFNGDL